MDESVERVRSTSKVDKLYGRVRCTSKVDE